jgi:type VI secretion system protein ImpL
MVSGDEPLVKRLAPGLGKNGYAVTGSTVLLYAKQMVIIWHEAHLRII